jgi:ABC-type phosphate/phosphonate transport system substrate-binding protein
MISDGSRFLVSLYAALAALLLMRPALAANEIIFSTAPTQPPAQTMKMYGPLANYLSKATGKKVVLEPARMFLQYTNNMRAGHYDLLFDGPHFVGWRMSHLGDKVVAKLPGSIVFLVVTRNDSGVKKIDDLAGKKVCSFASPNLLTLGFLDLFPDPARLPVMVKAKTFMGALKCVKSGHGVAAVMRDKFWYKRTPAQKKGLRLLYVSKTPFPHRAFSVSDKVDPATREKIKQALLSPEGTKMALTILRSFHVKHFVPAPPAEYKGMGRLLKPVWGFY